MNFRMKRDIVRSVGIHGHLNLSLKAMCTSGPFREIYILFFSY